MASVARMMYAKARFYLSQIQVFRKIEAVFIYRCWSKQRASVARRMRAGARLFLSYMQSIRLDVGYPSYTDAGVGRGKAMHAGRVRELGSSSAICRTLGRTGDIQHIRCWSR